MNHQTRLLSRRTGGFSLVELLVVVVVIGILAAMALPNYTASQDKAKLAAIKENMHTVQVSCEAYRTDAGRYPDTPTQIEPYLPGGGNTPGGSPGTRPPNPFNMSNSSMYVETMSTSQDVTNMRAAAPSAGPGTMGQVGYTPVDNGNSYAICGLDKAGNRVAAPGSGTLVLSNQ